CSAELLWLSDQDQTGIDLSLEEGASISGDLEDQNGEPVQGATVTATGTDQTVTGLSRTATTDADGHFIIQGLDATATQSTAWSCSVSVVGWPDQYLAAPPVYDVDDAEVYAVTAGQELAIGTSTLLDGIVLSGTVEGPQGSAQGATVYAYSGSQIQTVTTDEKGNYEAVGLPPGQALVWVTGDGLASTYYPDSDRPETFIDASVEGSIYDGLDLDAPAEATLEVSFTGAGAGVRAMLYNSTYTVGKGSSSDDQGVVTIDGLFDGAYTLFAWGYPVDLVNTWVNAVDGVPQPIDIIAGQLNQVSVDLPAGARLSGQLSDDNGDPVYGGSVYVTPTDGDTWSAVSDRDGNWSLGGLPAGDWLVEVSYGAYCDTDPGYVSLVWPGEPASDKAELITLNQGEQRDSIDFDLPRDDEHDGMSDQWETTWGLDPSRDDSQEDPDEDGVVNLDEYLLGTDPLSKEGTGCGCASAGSGAPRPATPLLALALSALLALVRRRPRPLTAAGPASRAAP
ncbi:MAG: hypothetical protein GXP62_04270, partial [Oligoflexia bacterium]|nr:hypothetical protein [Oligoflexia bacterium]